MKWSKLKQKIEERFADSIKQRVNIHLTSYRGHNGNSRSWITVDGIEKISLDNFTSFNENSAYFNELTPIENCLTHNKIKDFKRDKNFLCEKGEFSSFDFTYMAKKYLQTSAQDAIKSEHPLIRLFSVLDKKTGKRKIKQLQNDKNPIVSYFAKFRYALENLK